MRIIAGTWRSRLLVVPNFGTTRPMPDRVKQTVFDVLASYYGTPGGLPPLCVADIFAGSGSVGLEALSRGARACVFFERDRTALAALQENIVTLKADGEICRGDAWREASGWSGEPFELMFLDPPYRDSGDLTLEGRIARFLGRLASPKNAPPIVVLHHESGSVLESEADSKWRVFDIRTIGTNSITFLRHERQE
ncbi:MAG: RsmD family RNA methyltransferase [Planctomycetes bacterium]|nr:RsmD family RNA methyltransferase [Planctomycetota bacterium]MBI3832998.1 RsmD family RNA methyltransferase [Planctomycetota bacterium]